MYVEMEKTLRDFKFKHAEQTQMADTAVQVRKDMENLGARIYKVHRVYHRAV
jgi:ATP-dependent protease HslVU (ClpYQ) ATPase subunit